MNDKHFNSALLFAILVTIAAVLAQKYFPEKKFLVTPSSDAFYYIYATNNTKGTPIGFWQNESARTLRCQFDQNMPPNSFQACSFNQLLSANANDTKGIDLSPYHKVILDIGYTGKIKKLRVHIRNFNPLYSSSDNDNSSKFNSVVIDTSDLKTPLSISMDEFTIPEWWLTQFNIPRKWSRPEFSNAVTLGVEFYGDINYDINDFTIRKIEFIGEWISAENWYLLIISCWMLGIFSFTVKRLYDLRQQTQLDTNLISSLNKDKQKLMLESDKFRRLSTVDPLTEVYNRFGLDQVVNSLLNQAFEKDTNAPSYALMVLDIDYFKRINDRRGHDAGDRVLQAIASIIQTRIRKQDFLGRWGGEEFVVILPNTRKEFAIALAEKIRLVIADTVFEPDKPLSVTVSIGIGDRLDDEDFATTFKRVDNALYYAKEHGRNCCVLAKDSIE